MSRRFKWIRLVMVLAIPVFIGVACNANNDTEPDDQSNGDSEIIWGVDSASYTTENLLQCVRQSYGEPEVWGRYLGTNEGISYGIVQAEVELLHENNIEILVIYNHFREATGYDHGVNEAESAISMAEDLEIPAGVAIFADIEPSFPVDSAFIDGWYDALIESNYAPAIYGVFNEGSELVNAYYSTNDATQENMIVWTAHPQEGITTEENAPEYNPQGPENGQIYGWQYGIDAETCNIDTNLFRGDLSDYLW